MKELKEYLLSIWSIVLAIGAWLLFVALLTAGAGATWWVIRFIWNYFLEI
jgi:hypothetical protein